MKKEDQIEVSKIELKIAGKTISLKPDQARDLLAVLRNLFGSETNYITCGSTSSGVTYALTNS